MSHQSQDRGEIFLIPYSHLDTQWRWEYPTTIRRYLKSTLVENILMFEKHPGHRFNFTGALRYSMMKEYYPELFEQVKRLVAEGRWALAGTCLDETDALVPSAESMIRNILYGDRWQRKEFGRSSRDYMIPDCFGFPANMPTIMAHCGIRGFSSQKLTWGSAVGIPFEIGMWEGPDGSEIVSALNPHRYDSPLAIPVHLNPGRLARLRRLGRKNGVWKSFQYYGVGDIGGAPLEFSVKQALRSIRLTKRSSRGPLVRQGSSDEFFAAVTAEEKTRMDRYRGDLLLINHSAGTLTSAAVMKRWNRKNEQMAFAAEAAAVTARHIAGARYPREKIESAWHRMVGSQMHDILPGTSTPTAYEYSQNDEVIALNTWDGVLNDAAEALAGHTSGKGDILLFNPLAEARSGSVCFDVSHRKDLVEGPAAVTSPGGTAHAAQIIRGDEGQLTAVARLPMEPFAWARYSLDTGRMTATGTASPCIRRKEDNWILENRRLRLTVDDRGALVSIFDIGRHQELLARPMAYELQKEKPTAFPAWNMDWKDRKKSAAHRLEGGEVSILAEGPMRCGLRITLEFGSSLFVKDIFLDADSSMPEFVEHIDWFESGYSLKLALNTTITDSRVTCNWETSRISRGVNHRTCFEVPSRMWVDMSGDGQGFSLVEDSKYGYDHPSKDTLRMTFLYTPATRFLNGFRDQASHDWGHHTIRYGIRPHDGGRDGADALAREFNQPVRAFHLTSGPAEPGVTDLPAPSLLRLSNPDAGVMAVKLAEESDDILIRLYNRRGRGIVTTVSFCAHLAEVTEVNGLEEAGSALPFEGRSFTAELKANGVKAFRIRLEDAAPRADSRQLPVHLPLDTRAFSTNGDRRFGLYPMELVPPVIHSGAVEYRMGTKGPNQALSAAGQILKLPEGAGECSLLVAGDRPSSQTFRWIDIGGREISSDDRDIAGAAGFIGRWDTRQWKRRPAHSMKHRRDYAWLNRCVGVEPGFVNRSRLEWYATHTHSDGEDRAYQFGYMYTIRLSVPDAATGLLLPNDPTVKVFAAAVSPHGYRARPIQALTDKYDY